MNVEIKASRCKLGDGATKLLASPGTSVNLSVAYDPASEALNLYIIIEFE